LKFENLSPETQKGFVAGFQSFEPALLGFEEQSDGNCTLTELPFGQSGSVGHGAETVFGQSFDDGAESRYSIKSKGDGFFEGSEIIAGQ